MRRLLILSAVSALLLGAIPAGAIPDPIPGPVAPGWFGTDNIELHATLANNVDSAGGRVIEDKLYVTDDRGLTVYGLDDPLAPDLLGFHPAQQEPYVPEEDVDGNGEIVLIGALGSLEIIDVSDPANMSTIGSVGVDDHTVTCVLDCTYAWGSEGFIVDIVAQEQVALWTDSTRPFNVTGSHDVTEIAPGIVLTSSNPMLLLDARENPTSPKVIGKGEFGDNRFIHGNLWPYQGEVAFDDPAWDFDPNDFDDFVLVGGETSLALTGCDENDGAFMTFNWSQPGLDQGDEFIEFGFIDEYRVEAGTYIDGGSPYDQFCAHWFTTQPGYANGGVVAMAWYEHGTRFLTVESDGMINTDLGWIIPFGSSQSGAYWVTDEIVYTTDYQRGVDILIVDTDPEETPQAHTVPGAQFLRNRALLPTFIRDSQATSYRGCAL